MSEVRVLRRITDELARASGSLPDGEATALWASVAGLKPAEVWLRRDADAAPDVTRRFWEAVEQRKRGVPFAYVAGHVGFRTLDLKIDPRALIPRPETEGLVELTLRESKKRDRGDRTRGLVADVGTGSGCIALALAVEGRFEKVIAVEQSHAAIELARENVARIAPATPVEVRQGNLLEPLMNTGERFRAIVSNPPYVTLAEYDLLDRSVREFEPREALVSGADGLDATRALFAGAAQRGLLEPDGFLALEIDERRADAVRTLGREYGWTVAIHADLFGCPRYALCTPGHGPDARSLVEG
ncbi:MAG TPA: peptide chain release factor N(5)-glutamine methyltransferase [Gemmatimonadales bacterium]|nr:peptide chain release factor N(5)-glutamine methyltransferase [Gemmatimonadales bacterium]